MPDENVHIFSLDNGLTLLVEEMPHVRSAALALLTPAGVIHEPEGCNGASAALCDLLMRGAGERNSRELSAALDRLGLQRNENVGWNFLTFSCAGLAENVLRGVPLYADVVQRPWLQADQLPAVLDGVEQGLLAEQDDPQRQALTELRRQCYDAPWNRPTDGTLAELPEITIERLQDLAVRGLRPNGSIIGVAGNVRAADVLSIVRESFGDWKRQSDQQIVPRPTATRIPRHLPHESTQTQIALAYAAVPYGHADYYAAWGAISILSGGTSSRLFTEVRENRGLCYSVYASLHTLLSEGRVMAYAGTTAPRAQETLDVLISELVRLGDGGITPEELARCRARAKSSLVMQQESTSSRAASLARDWFHLGRVTTLEEIRSAVDALTIEQITDYVCRYPARDITLLTIGPEPLQMKS